ncbi:MAG: WYL domain-containing protein [Lachnospiraceae bacterium]|nr:WYL domain-containing protein [Lachnospiraceae bacterium]
MTTLKKVPKTEIEKHFNRLHPILIIFILKYCSDYEHPLNPPAVAERLANLTGTHHDIKTVTRCLEDLYTLTATDVVSAEICENLEKGYALTFGGYICVSEKKKNGYYFEPHITPSDIHTLQGTIASNRYISAQDRDYLQGILEQTAPQTCITDSYFTEKLPDTTERHWAKDVADGDLLFQKHTDFMGVVGALYRAITEKVQVAVTTGEYTLSRRHKRKVVFKKSEQPDILNPYALFWHMGEFYLLATKTNEERPLHLRIDRIVRARKLSAPCDLIPKRLQPYFNEPNSQFLAGEYTSVHPLMTPSTEEDLVCCKLECRADTLSILVDAFGVEKLQIEISPISHKGDLSNIHRPDSAYFTVKIDQVQYDNIREFCLRYRHLVTALQPTRLATDLFLASCDDFARYLDIFPDMLQGNWSAVDGFLKGCNSLIAAAQGHGASSHKES